MNLCGLCKRLIAAIVCRRCGTQVCASCVSGHGLCVKCRKMIRGPKRAF